jgi:hypothetical protein
MRSDVESDPWPDEPDEFDPEARWSNPERDLPKIPRVREPEVPEGAGDLDTDVASAFWASVFYLNVAFFALGLGPMLIVFRGQWKLGAGLVIGGLLALVRTYQIYRALGRRDGE